MVYADFDMVFEYPVSPRKMQSILWKKWGKNDGRVQVTTHRSKDARIGKPDVTGRHPKTYVTRFDPRFDADSVKESKHCYLGKRMVL
jgi:hypothetical protein